MANTFLKPEQQLALIERGAIEIIPRDLLHKKLERSYREQKPLRVKAGFDPTAPDIHLGHTVLIQKMKQFQSLGHEVIFLVGDFTARIGDPTGRSKLRQPLTEIEVKENAQTYTEQAFKILDPQKTLVQFNSAWLSKMSAAELIEMTTHYTVARMLERDDFAKRYSAQEPISIREFMYPLLQGYDSLALNADIELGGNDQKFNLLMGRELQKAYGKEPQCILTVPLLEGLDGKMKMSKSYGNYIGVDDAPKDMFGKVMSISDDLMLRYYELLSEMNADAFAALKKNLIAGSVHPKDCKINLAKEIVTRYWSQAHADREENAFHALFKKKEVPDLAEIVDSIALPSDPVSILTLTMSYRQQRISNSEFRRQCKQGAVKYLSASATSLAEGKLIQDPDAIVSVEPGGKLRIGKKIWLKFEK